MIETWTPAATRSVASDEAVSAAKESCDPMMKVKVWPVEAFARTGASARKRRSSPLAETARSTATRTRPVIAERTLPAGDVVEASQGHPVQTLEPIGQQTEDEVAEERSARLHRQQEPTRGEGVGDLAEKAALGPVQDVACQDRVEAAFRQVGFVLDHGDAARQGEAGALGEAAIGLEHRKVRGDSTGDGGRLGRERPEPELKQAQGPVRRKVGPGAVEDTGDHIRGCTSAGATQDEGVESVLRQGGLAREVTVEEAGDDGTEIRREHQFGG